MFAGAHPPNAQRHYNVLCLAHGAKPEVFGDVTSWGRARTGARAKLRRRIRHAAGVRSRGSFFPMSTRRSCARRSRRRAST